MRYIAFLFCFLLSLLGAYSFSKSNIKTASVEQPIAVTTPTQSVENVPKEPAIKNSDDYLPYWSDQSLEYNGLLITNSKKGLSISRGGKRLLFIKNESDDQDRNGRFGLKSLLGGDEKQLIYETRTGGNHCCIYHSIVDLSTKSPRFLFRSLDYDVYGDPWASDPLGLFDADGDGVLEITQSDTYYVPHGIMSANPVIDIGLKYDKRLQKYMPTSDFIPGQEAYISKVKQTIVESNKLIVDGRPNLLPDEYQANLIDVALNYAFAGRSKEGFEYVRNNICAYSFDNEKLTYDAVESASWANEVLANVHKHLRKVRIYRVVSQR